jgi:hypothetical protein
VPDDRTRIAIPSGELAHSCFGRTRIAFDALRGDAAAGEALRARVAELPGVVDVEFRPLTGSLVVAHWGQTDGLIGDAKANGVFLIEQVDRVSRAEARAEAMAASIEESVASLFSGHLNVRLLASLAFAVMTVRQIAAGNIAPSAAAAFWNSVLLLLAEKGMGKLGGMNKPAAD